MRGFDHDPQAAMQSRLRHMDEPIPPSPDKREPGPEFAKIPLRIMRERDLSPGAKLLYARLGLFSGKDGVCNPSHATLAGEIAVSDRRIRELLIELRECGLVSWRRTQKANSYTVDSPEHFLAPERKKTSGQSGRKRPTSSEGSVRSDRKNPSDKKMSLKRSLSKDVSSKEVSDYDCLPQNRKKRDSAAGRALLARYPNLRTALREHWKETDRQQPSANKVIRIIQATGHAPEAEIIEALHNLAERGYDADHIRVYGYFETALPDYFRQEREREEAASPCGYDQWSDRNETRSSREQFDAMTDAIEIPIAKT